MEQILLTYLRENEGQWFKKVSLYVLADEAGYSPETAGRALRELAEKSKIKVDYYDGKFSKGLAKYAYNPIQPSKPRVEVREVNGQMVAVVL